MCSKKWPQLLWAIKTSGLFKGNTASPSFAHSINSSQARFNKKVDWFCVLLAEDRQIIQPIMSSNLTLLWILLFARHRKLTWCAISFSDFHSATSVTPVSQDHFYSINVIPRYTTSHLLLILLYWTIIMLKEYHWWWIVLTILTC